MAKTQTVSVSNPMMVRGIDRLLTVQRPVVLAHIRSIRRGRPNASPAEIIRTLERRYLTAVTTGGAAVGATAVVPAIGTGTSLALSAVETAGFLEASALFAQSITEVHGIVVDDPDRARALVMTMVLGTAGTDWSAAAGQVAAGPARSRSGGEIKRTSPPSWGPYDRSRIRRLPSPRAPTSSGDSSHSASARRRRWWQPPAWAPDQHAREGFGPAPERSRVARTCRQGTAAAASTQAREGTPSRRHNRAQPRRLIAHRAPGAGILKGGRCL